MSDMIEINGRYVSLQTLRDVDPRHIAPMLGLTVEQLCTWARGVGLPYGLPWRDEH